MSRIKRITRKKIVSDRLYNLAVEQDESYIANGIVVHNCRSLYTPITHDEQKMYGFTVDGKPNDVPVYSSVSTFKDVELSEIENEIKDILKRDGETS